MLSQCAESVRCPVQVLLSGGSVPNTALKATPQDGPRAESFRWAARLSSAVRPREEEWKQSATSSRRRIVKLIGLAASLPLGNDMAAAAPQLEVQARKPLA